MNVPRLMLSATSSGSGKTTITCGILKALVNRGLQVTSFKCGPDYIDPMFHSKIIGTVSRNIDAFFCDDYLLKGLFCRTAEGSDVSVIEGVMGFYDGTDIDDTEASSCDVASRLGTPVILIIDAKGAARSVLATLKGFLEFEGNTIAGVIFNRMTQNTFERLKVHVRAMGVEPIGYVPRLSTNLGSRHLGLMLPDEVSDLKERLCELAETLESTLDIGNMLRIASKAEPLECPDIGLFSRCTDIRVGLARDEAFCFVYEDNIDMLRMMGAEVIEFSPLHDMGVPDVDMIILPGGYPELHCEALESNSGMRLSIKAALEGGMPCLAECGGFMYLHSTMEDAEGRVWNMCDVISGSTWNTGRLKRFGYITIKKGDLNVKGHEFHYWDSDTCGKDWVAMRRNGQSYRCMHDNGNIIVGYPHLFYPSCPGFLRLMIRRAERYRSCR